jgi:hypothetical protein
MKRRAFLTGLLCALARAQRLLFRPDDTPMRIDLLAGPTNTAYSLAASAVQSVNLYPETIDAGGKSKIILRGRPGIHVFKDITTIDAGASPARGLWAGGGRLFVAAGTKEFEVDSGGSLVGSTHTIADDIRDTPVTILPNSNQLLIVSAGSVYCDNGAGPTQITFSAISGQCSTNAKVVTLETTPNGSTGHTDSFDIGMVGQTITIDGTGYTVASVTNPSLLQLTATAGTQTSKDWSCTPTLTAPTAAFLDGYYMAPRTGSRQWNISKLLDGTQWNIVDGSGFPTGAGFAYKEGYTDNLLAVWSEPPISYLLGTETMEAWRNTGNSSFPFERVDGGFARIGLVGSWACASIMGKLHMVASGTYGAMVAVRMEGMTPVRISTYAVEEALNALLPGGDVYTYSYVDRGHWFWVIHLKGTHSWVYDATESARQGTPIWHERMGGLTGITAPYESRFHAFIPEWGTGGKHITGSYNRGKLYEMSSDFFDDNGGDIEYIRALPYVYEDGKRIYHHRFELELETGTASTPPTVTLDWSDNEGQTWGTGSGGVGTSMTLGPGVSGTYTTRYYAHALGSSRGRVYRIKIIGQGKIAVIAAMLDVDVGAN